MVETLYIDSNEPTQIKQKITEEIAKRSDIDIDIEIEGLKTGDFIIGDTVIERKEKSDLHSSVTDKRAKEQTSRMAADFSDGYIIIEGDAYNQEYSNLHPNSITGTLISTAAKKDLKIIPTKDKDSTAYTVYKIAKIVSENETFEADEYKLKRSGAETEDVNVAMLSQVKGVSKEKAEKIFEETQFDNVAQIAYLIGDNTELYARKELQKVDGIGEKISGRVADHLAPKF